MIALDPHDALIVTDVQNDFLPGGALAVARADEIVPVLNEWIARAVAVPALVVATRDWHPADHCSFRERGGPWPRHCVQGSSGAEFAASLRLPPSTLVISKATDPTREAYSSFEGTELDRELHARGIRRLFIGGVATDYCVVSTTRDALAKGYEVHVLRDAIRAVDVNPGDGAHAEAEMVERGARLVTLEALASALAS